MSIKKVTAFKLNGTLEELCRWINPILKTFNQLYCKSLLTKHIMLNINIIYNVSKVTNWVQSLTNIQSSYRYLINKYIGQNITLLPFVLCIESELLFKFKHSLAPLYLKMWTTLKMSSKEKFIFRNDSRIIFFSKPL